jgi:ribosomal protein L11 methyltransferase
MSTDQYHIVLLKNVSVAAEDWLSSFAFECGAAGMSENLKFEPKPGTDEVRSVLSEIKELQIYFEETPPPDFFEGVQSRFPETVVQAQTRQKEDWMEGWKKHFKAFELVDGFFVVPSWLDAPAEAKKVLSVDPGMAFGTGTHETTSMMAKELFKVSHSPQGKKLLDVGTGTGILAILGAFLGYAEIVATDTDRESQRVANENFALNQVKVQMDERQIQDLSGAFDVVLANIIEGVLALIQKELFRKVAPGGALLLSGILADNEEEFKKEFILPPGARWTDRRQNGEWLCLVAQWP